MQTNALFMGWNRPKAGRESQAGELFQAVTNYWSGLEQDGKIDGFQPVLLTSHGGDMNGFFLVNGAVENLNEIRNSEEFLKIVLQCNYVLDGFGVVAGYHGEEVGNVMNQWTQMIGGS